MLLRSSIERLAPDSLRRTGLSRTGWGWVSATIMVLVAACAPAPRLPSQAESGTQGFLALQAQLSEAVQSDRRAVAPRRALALALLANGYPSLSADAWSELLPLEDSPSISRWYLCRALLAAGRHAEALRELSSAAKNPKAIAPTLFELARLRLLEGDLATAQRLYTRLQELRPDLALATVGLAEVALAKGHFDKAVALAQTALDQDPSSPAAPHLLASALRSLGQLEEASVWMAKAPKNQSKFIPGPWDSRLYPLIRSRAAALVQVRLWLEEGSFENAVQLASAAVTWPETTHEPELREALAVALIALRRPSLALEALVPLADNPLFGTAINSATAHLALGDFDSALRAASLATEIAPQRSRSHHLLGRAHWASGALEQALLSLRHASELEPTNVDVLRDLAFIELATGNTHVARGVSERIVNLAPHLAVGYLGLAEVALVDLRWEEVTTFLLDAERHEPQHPGIANVRGRLQVATKAASEP